VYAVRRGDTLLAIAAHFGVTAEAIQLANGIVDPRRLQIDQLLIIPGPEADSGEPATPTPTPPPLAVRGLRVEKTPLGTLWAMGEVHNPGTAPISEVAVGISLLDAQGNVMATETTPPQLDVVAPGQSVAFAVQFAPPLPPFVQYRAEIVSGTFTSSETRYYLELAITDTRSLTTSTALCRLSGSLHNIGAGDVEQVRLLATGYDAQNRVAALRQIAILPAILHPEAAVPFEVELSWVGSPVVTYSLQAQGLRVQ
jgi:murein DD-endopeptidase MepM/ murein hydrolase activator NlpD